MKQLGLNDIRERFLAFFESKEHLRLQSAPLVPQGDNSLLLINSGMAPLKPYFSGEMAPPQGRRRVTTCQKCIRTPDIERVGKTSRHGTFFEMLGNFSFGDYFKPDACKWAWEFITEVMELPVEKLYVTVYNGEGNDGSGDGLQDDEAYEIWTKQVGVDPAHVSRLGKADNFWEIGAGPCGPCSEIYFDRGEQYGCGKDDCAVGCDCDRYVEFWNLVFTQFNNDGNGNYTQLASKNIDTGMGLERLACILQGVNSLFDVDTIMNITKHVSRITGKSYGESDSADVSLRVITDHIRSTTMMISDGVLPSNEGRGYVLRRLLRRAARHGKLLGVDKPFLFEVCETVIAESKAAYPELDEKKAHIIRVIKAEEERFAVTIDSGSKILAELISGLEKGGTLDAENTFKLYDTFGFPIDLTLEILEENGLSADTDGFDVLMKEQRERARAATAQLGDFGWDKLELGLPKEETTVFVGYEQLSEDNAKVRAVGEGWLVLDRTPFYAEMGGQIADTGVILLNGEEVFKVTGVRKTKDGKYLHLGEWLTDSVQPGDLVSAAVDTERRKAIMRAHSSAHLLHAALRAEIGSHIEQAGSWVGPDRVRFDFTHFESLEAEQLSRITARINSYVLRDLPVRTEEMPLDEAKKSGAIALFGEKYGDTVRVVTMGEGNFRESVELCGGTHLANTAKIGQFRVISEFSVAAGVRRIEAVTGFEAITSYIKDITEQQGEVEKKEQDIKALRKELDRALRNNARNIANMLVDKCGGDKNIIAAVIGNLDNEKLKLIAEALRDIGTNVACLASVTGDKTSYIAIASKEAIAKGIKAGEIIKRVAAKLGGKGGGKPDVAMGGGPAVPENEDLSKLLYDTVNEYIAEVEHSA
ncbi:MAG: alanine--tRNA ligase [Oscillospiraceae bacterium]|jgi:alanyl-tRNA synthetase|nr:alanine--tRNA ligase [Oscillospiraceae bacterium]